MLFLGFVQAYNGILLKGGYFREGDANLQES